MEATMSSPKQQKIVNSGSTLGDEGTLEGVYYALMDMPHPKTPQLKNGDRKPNDLKNHERALRCFAAGVNDGDDDLSKVAGKQLCVNDAVLGRAVERGAAVLNARKEKPASEKTLKNLISCCKAVRQAAGEGRGALRRSLYQVERDRPKRRYRPPFPKAVWPEALREDFEGYARWKTKAFLSPEEGAQLRRKASRPITVKAYANRIAQYVGFLVRERGLLELTLVDLCRLSHYADFLNWYLNCDAVGGYRNAQSTGTTLGTIAQYLVATGRLARTGPSGQDIWAEFYELSGKALEVGAVRGELLEAEDVGRWKPQDLLEVGREGWRTPPERRRRGDERGYGIRTFNCLRSALFFVLAFETPLRARNFREMRWDHNLKRNADGRYELRFRGLELKVASRGFRTNEYRHTYSEEASAYIGRWRDHLRGLLGDAFEERCPYVFASSNLGGGPVSDSVFRHHVSALVYELRGETFNPHRVRHIVASYLVKEVRGGHNLAARLLGNRKETVLSTYDRPNVDEALEEYLAGRRGGR